MNAAWWLGWALVALSFFGHAWLGPVGGLLLLVVGISTTRRYRRWRT